MESSRCHSGSPSWRGGRLGTGCKKRLNAGERQGAEEPSSHGSNQPETELDLNGGGNGVKRRVRGRPELGAWEGPGCSLSAKRTEHGLQPAQTTSLLDGRIWAAGAPGAAQTEEGSPSQPPSPRQDGCSRSRPDKDLVSPEKAQTLGGLGGAGAGAGTGKRRQRADQDSNVLQAEFQGRDPAYVCTCVSWTSPATSRLLMEGRLVRRW